MFSTYLKFRMSMSESINKLHKINIIQRILNRCRTQKTGGEIQNIPKYCGNWYGNRSELGGDGGLYTTPILPL